jgi:hypothetical protein
VGKFLEGCYEELSLYVRQSAWLNATPERPKNYKSEAPMLSRLEGMRKDRRDDEYDPPMPEVNAGYLLDHLFEIGPTMSAGGYPGPITHEEIMAWMELTGVPLQPWESRFIRRLSCEYIAEQHRAAKPDCPEPVLNSGNGVADLSVVARSMQESLKALANL